MTKARQLSKLLSQGQPLADGIQAADVAGLAVVASSGSYTDLSNKPSLGVADYNQLLNKPTLATVATSGSYTDLTNKPNIATQGAQGPKGDTGDIGPKGDTGDIGPTGPQGAPALWNFLGAYNGNAEYHTGDVVTYQGNTWYALRASQYMPPDPAIRPEDWILVATKGINGADGAVGLTGPAGASTYIYNVKNYGAQGNSTTDDTAAIQAAINAAQAATSGGTVFFPTGIYKLTSAITISPLSGQPLPRVHLLGEGMGASVLLQSNAAASGIVIAAASTTAIGSETTIKGLTITGTGAGVNTQNGIGIQSTAYISITDCEIIGFATGIYADNFLSSILDHVLLEYNDKGFRFEPYVGATGFSESNAITLLSCVIGHNTTYGGWINGAGTFNVIGGSIENNGTGTDLSPSKWGLKITDSGGQVADSASNGFSLHGVYFEGNGGKAQLWVEQTVLTAGLASSIVGCSFNRLGTAYTSANIWLEASNVAYAFPIAISGTGFSALGGYTPNVARPNINNVSDFFPLSLVAVKFDNVTDQYKQGASNRFEGGIEAGSFKLLNGSVLLIGNKIQNLGSVSGTQVVDLKNGGTVIATVVGSTNWTFTGLVAGEVNSVALLLTNPGIGTQTLSANTVFDKNTAPILPASGKTLLVLETYDNGASWIASQAWRNVA